MFPCLFFLGSVCIILHFTLLQFSSNSSFVQSWKGIKCLPFKHVILKLYISLSFKIAVKNISVQNVNKVIFLVFLAIRMSILAIWNTMWKPMWMQWGNNFFLWWRFRWMHLQRGILGWSMQLQNWSPYM